MSIVGPLRKFNRTDLNWQTRLLESDITPILQNESIQSDTLKKAYIFLSLIVGLFFSGTRMDVVILNSVNSFYFYRLSSHFNKSNM